MAPVASDGPVSIGVREPSGRPVVAALAARMAFGRHGGEAASQVTGVASLKEKGRKCDGVSNRLERGTGPHRRTGQPY